MTQPTGELITVSRLSIGDVCMDLATGRPYVVDKIAGTAVFDGAGDLRSIGLPVVRLASATVAQAILNLMTAFPDATTETEN